MTFAASIAALILAGTCLFALQIGLGLRRMRQLRMVPPLDQGDAIRRVSIVIAACNEALTISPALVSLLHQDYGNFEIIVANDRSTDATAEVLGKLQDQYPQLRVVTINQLPPGWLGKAHALQAAAAAATGDLLLFSDADIRMAPTAVSRAVRQMENARLDHLTIFFENTSPGWLLNGIILDMSSAVLLAFRPWRVGKAGSRNFVGVGAFNMVRRTVYESCGRHQRIKMQPIDDVMLGKIIKRAGYRQDCLLGNGMISVDWYSGVGEMIQGLMKNVFAALHYRVWLALLAMIAILIMAVLPLWGAIFADGRAQLLFALTVLVRLAGFTVGARISGLPWTVAIGGLLAPHFTVFIIAKAMSLTLRQGGIYWRGTFYALADLRKAEPLLW